MKKKNLQLKSAENTPQKDDFRNNSEITQVKNSQKVEGEWSLSYKTTLFFLALAFFFCCFSKETKAQSVDIINGITTLSGDLYDARNVKPLNPTGTDGYYVSGFLRNSSEAFVARVDEHGNPFWVNRMGAVDVKRITMNVDNQGNVWSSVAIDGQIHLFCMDMTGSNTGAYPMTITFPGNDAVPAALKPLGTSRQEMGVLSINSDDEYIYFCRANLTGGLVHSHRYRAVGLNKQGGLPDANTATFVHKNLGADPNIMILYGTERGLTSVCNFEIDAATGTLTSPIRYNLVYNQFGHPAEVNVHDVFEIPATAGTGPGFLVAYAHGFRPFIGRLNFGGVMDWSFEFDGDYPNENNHLVHIQEGNTREYNVMGLSFDDDEFTNPGHIFFVEFDLSSSTSFIDNQRVTELDNSSFPGLSRFPASFARNSGQFPVLSSNTIDPAEGIPFYALNATNNLTTCAISQSVPDLYDTDLDFFTNPTNETSIGIGLPVHTASTDLPIAEILCNDPCPVTPVVEIEYEGCFITNPSITLDAVATGFVPTNYLWLPDGQTTQDITVTTPGTYTVFAFDAVSGCADQATITVDDDGLAGWQQYSTSSNTNWVEVGDVERDDDGNIYVLGTFNDQSVDFFINPNLGDAINIGTGSSGRSSMYIAKYDVCGKLEWIGYVDLTGFTTVDVEGVDIEFRDDQLHILYFNNAPFAGYNITIEYADQSPSNIIPGLNSIDNYSIGSLNPDGTLGEPIAPVILTMNPPTGTYPEGDELTCLEFAENINGDNVYYIAGRHYYQGFIGELEYDVVLQEYGLNTTLNNYIYSQAGTTPTPGGATYTINEIINDIEAYINIGDKMYATGKYEFPGIFNSLLGTPPGIHDAFIGAFLTADLTLGFTHSGSSWEESPGSATAAEGIEIDYNEIGLNAYHVYVTGEYQDDLINWGISATTTHQNAFVSMIEDGVNLSHIWTYTFNADPSYNFVAARGTSVIIEPNSNRLYAAGEMDTDILEEDGGGGTSFFGSGAVGDEMWVAEIDVNNGHGDWLSGGTNPDIRVRGIAAYDDQAFVTGYTNSSVVLSPDVAGWPNSQTLPTASSGARDMFTARVGDFPGSGSGRFYKKYPNTASLNDDSDEKVKTIEDWEVRVYPNPSYGVLQISLNSTSGESWGIELFTSTGSLAKRVEKINSALKNYQADWSELPAGLYLVRIVQGDNVQTKRLVIH